jgi:AraC-like DNA-binding protein
MDEREWSQLRQQAELNVGLLHAYYIEHAYPRHSHDYYVISLIERGNQSFTHKGMKHLTLPGGIILINPDEAHTGEAADDIGFELRSIYPTVAHMEMAAFELTGRHQGVPFFKEVRVNNPRARNNILSLHKALMQKTDALEYESRFIWTLVQLIQQYADISRTEQRLGTEKRAIQQARRYIDENFASGVSLHELAQHVRLSPYYFLRVFRAEVGMPPYAYLESVRIGQAQKLIEAGKPLAEAAIEAGFSSQSHMTNSFKKIIGATPGQYAGQIRSH